MPLCMRVNPTNRSKIVTRRQYFPSGKGGENLPLPRCCSQESYTCSTWWIIPLSKLYP